ILDKCIFFSNRTTYTTLNTILWTSVCDMKRLYIAVCVILDNRTCIRIYFNRFGNLFNHIETTAICFTVGAAILLCHGNHLQPYYAIHFLILCVECMSIQENQFLIFVKRDVFSLLLGLFCFVSSC